MLIGLHCDFFNDLALYLKMEKRKTYQLINVLLNQNNF